MSGPFVVGVGTRGAADGAWLQQGLLQLLPQREPLPRPPPPPPVAVRPLTSRDEQAIGYHRTNYVAFYLARNFDAKAVSLEC